MWLDIDKKHTERDELTPWQHSYVLICLDTLPKPDNIPVTPAKRFSETPFFSVREHQLSAHTPAIGTAEPWALPPGRPQQGPGQSNGEQSRIRKHPEGRCAGFFLQIIHNLLKKKKISKNVQTDLTFVARWRVAL